MTDYPSKIKKLKHRIAVIKKEKFQRAPNGTHHKVFLSKNYVIRFRDDNPKLLLREAKFLKQFNHPLMPKIIWKGNANRAIAAIENRLPGTTLDTIWKNLGRKNQQNIIHQLIIFLKYLRGQNKDYIYSVNTGARYKNFLDYLRENSGKKIRMVKKFEQAQNLIKELSSIINQLRVKKIFGRPEISVVHGDLIIHNLLTDGKNLTGVLDWELALFGDPEYDICRLLYYKECSKSYAEQKADETFETDFLTKFLKQIFASNLIKNKMAFLKKYKIIRAFFYLNALNWAASSSDPKKNLAELINLWQKNKRVKISIS